MRVGGEECEEPMLDFGGLIAREEELDFVCRTVVRSGESRREAVVEKGRSGEMAVGGHSCSGPYQIPIVIQCAEFSMR
jgi:hypothetical protein